MNNRPATETSPINGQSVVALSSSGDESLDNNVLPTTCSYVTSATMPVNPESVCPHPNVSFYASYGNTSKKKTKYKILTNTPEKKIPEE